MAIIERPPDAPEQADAAAPAVTASSSYGFMRRPVETTGWKSWAFTVDHKKIGIMYGVTAMFFFVIGGAEALLIRIQLATPNGTLLSPDVYNQVFTIECVSVLLLAIKSVKYFSLQTDLMALKGTLYRAVQDLVIFVLLMMLIQALLN